MFKIQRPRVNHIVIAKDMGSVTFLLGVIIITSCTEWIKTGV